MEKGIYQKMGLLVHVQKVSQGWANLESFLQFEPVANCMSARGTIGPTVDGPVKPFDLSRWPGSSNFQLPPTITFVKQVLPFNFHNFLPASRSFKKKVSASPQKNPLNFNFAP